MMVRLAVVCLCLAIPSVALAEKKRDASLPEGALARLGGSRLRHGGNVLALALAPDARLLASSGRDDSVRIWDLATGTQVSLLKTNGTGPNFHAGALIFSRDSKMLVSGDHAGYLRLWDVKTGAELRTFGQAPRTIRCMVLADDGRTLWTAGRDETLCEWQLDTGAEVRRIPAPTGMMHSLTLTPDGKQLIGIVSEIPQRPLTAPSDNTTVHIWDVATGKQIRQFDIPSAPWDMTLCHAFSPDRKTLVLMGKDCVLRHYDVDSGKLTRQVEEDHRIHGLAISADGKRLASVSDSLRVSDFATGKVRRALDVPQPSRTVPVLFTPDGKFVACAAENSIRILDIDNNRDMFPEAGHDMPLASLALSPDGKRLLSTDEHHVGILWDVAGRKEIGRVGRHFDSPFLMATLGPDSTVLCGMHGNVTRFRPQVSAEKLRRYEGFGYSLRSLATSDDARLLAVLGSSAVPWVFDTQTGEVVARLGENMKRDPPVRRALPAGRTPTQIRLSGDGRLLASARFTCPLEIWDVRSGKLLHSIGAFGNLSGPLCFSPDGRTIALCDNTDLHIFEVPTSLDQRPEDPQGQTLLPPGQRHLRLVGEGLKPTCLAYSADGAVLLAGSADGLIRMLEVASGRLLGQLDGHAGDVRALAVARDEHTFASAAADTTILVWDGKLLARIGMPTPIKLDVIEFRQRWQVLAGDDARQAHQAVWSLVAAADQSIPFLKAHLRPAPPLDREQVARWVADLGSDSFPLRQKATEMLEKVGDFAEPELVKALNDKSATLELTRRIQRLLTLLKEPPLEKTRTLRALEILEHVATPEARAILATLAQGRTGHWLTEDARKSLERLKRRT